MSEAPYDDVNTRPVCEEYVVDDPEIRRAREILRRVDELLAWLKKQAESAP